MNAIFGWARRRNGQCRFGFRRGLHGRRRSGLRDDRIRLRHDRFLARDRFVDRIAASLDGPDPEAGARMIVALKARGYTIVMVEQNFRFAAPLADRFYVMEHGRIVESFGAPELQAKMPVLTELLGV